MTSQAQTVLRHLQARPDFGAGISTKATPPVPPDGDLKPEHSQASRALGLASYFVTGCMSLVLFSSFVKEYAY